MAAGDSGVTKVLKAGRGHDFATAVVKIPCFCHGNNRVAARRPKGPGLAAMPPLHTVAREGGRQVAWEGGREGGEEAGRL